MQEEGIICKTLFEYFYIFGANEKTVKLEKFYRDNLFTIPGYLKMQLISKFPPFKKPNSDIDKNVIMNHCFLNGFNLYVMEKPNDFPKNESFHFCLDNLNSLGNNDKKIYFTSLLFYEPLSIYYEILIRLKKQSNQNIKGITGDLKELMEKYYVPKVICFSSFVPFPQEEKYLLNKILAYVNGMTKGIQYNIIIPIEKIVEKIVLGIPLPPRGKFYISIKNSNCIIPNCENGYDIMQRKLNEYNYYSYKMHLIFIFKIDDILEIIKCLLLEIPILFFSINKEKLTNIFETFLFIIRPFEYQYPHVSILPDINAGIIELAKCFAFGINYEWIDKDNKEGKKTYFEMLNINVFDKLIKIVDIDNCVLKDYLVKKNDQKIKNLRNSSNLSKEKKYELPEHYSLRLKKRLHEFIENNKIKSSDCNMNFNRIIGEDIFYYFFASVFQNYNKYLYNTEKETRKICSEIKKANNEDEIPIEHLFNIKGFVGEFKIVDEPFLMRFFLTKIFKNFLIRKYLNNDIDKFIFLHFDETILCKKNKSIFKKSRQTEFLASHLLDISQCLGVDNAFNFSNEEYEYICTHLDELINYYQKFNGEIFTYYLFPKLIYDNQYFESHYLPQKFFDKFLLERIEDYQKAIESIGQPQYFKIYEGDLIKRHLYNSKNDLVDNEIKNDVLLLWLRLFCLTFYYCETKEKMVRFVEVMDNIKKVFYLKDDILSLLLITLNKYGDNVMMLKFFENFDFYNYNEFAYLSNKIYYSYTSEQSQLKQLPLYINYYKEKEEIN